MTAPVEGRRYRHVVEGVVTRVIAGGRIVYMLDDTGQRWTWGVEHHMGAAVFEPVDEDCEAAS